MVATIGFGQVTFFFFFFFLFFSFPLTTIPLFIFCGSRSSFMQTSGATCTLPLQVVGAVPWRIGARNGACLRSVWSHNRGADSGGSHYGWSRCRR